MEAFVRYAIILLLIASSAAALTDCQKWTIKNWGKAAVNFQVWSIVSNENNQCYVSTPTLADANAVADNWVNGIHE
jgi:hypothetical protein